MTSTIQFFLIGLLIGFFVVAALYVVISEIQHKNRMDSLSFSRGGVTPVYQFKKNGPFRPGLTRYDDDDAAD